MTPSKFHILFLLASLSFSLLLSFLSCYGRLGVEALKLTSLGSTIEELDGNGGSGGGDTSLIPSTYDNSNDADATCSSSASGTSASLASSTIGSVNGYGLDYSFPIHYLSVFWENDKNSLTSPFGIDKTKFYQNFLRGCRDKYAPKGFLCDENERERMEMNLRQPKGMYNYTTNGFHKLKAPPKLMSILRQFWKDNFMNDPDNYPGVLSTLANIQNETWPPGNTYTNHWSSPTKMLLLGDSTLNYANSPAGESIRTLIWDQTKPILESWAGVPLSHTSLYGVRIYTRGAVLAPHVDRNPLVISAIINVDQRMDKMNNNEESSEMGDGQSDKEVEEGWPLEVIGHDGKAYNITMNVGDMVLYESHSVIHGRPFPLKGDYYANVFIHFEPLGHSLLHENLAHESTDEQSLENLYQKAWEQHQSKCQPDDKECLQRVDLNVGEKVPYYIVPGSEEEQRWVQAHPRAKLAVNQGKNFVSTLNAHSAASSGDLDALVAINAIDPTALHKVDSNGWTPLHEAARGGHVEVVEYLIGKGLDVNHRTHGGKGGSVLWWAKKAHGGKGEIVRYLEGLGAKDIAPE